MKKSWQKTTLGKHVELLTGYPFKSIEYTNDERAMRLLRGDNVIQGSIRWDDVKRWGGLTETKILRYFLKEGDFVIAMDRTWVKAGLKASLITKQDTPSLLVQRVARLRVKNGLHSKILPQLIRSHIFEQYVKGVQTETAVPHISPQQINDFPVLLPPLSEQRAIANLLSTWDEAIEKTERLIHAKEKRFKWLRSSLITDEKEWTEVKLGVICKVKKGEQLNVAHMKADGSYYALNGGIKPSGRTDDWNTEAGIITISEGGNSCGYVNFNTEKFWSGGHCYSLLNVKKSVNMHYLFFYLKMNEPKLMNLRVGSGLPNIQKKDVDRIKVSFPTLSVQQQIAQTLNATQQEIDILDQMLNKYKILKCGLMQKMLTGEWRVKPEIVNQYMEA